MKTEFQKGDYIEGRYHVRHVLGGGMGTVYVALDIALDQIVAIKTFHTRYADRLSEWFLAESQTWIQLERHPHVVQAKTTFLIRGRPFLVVEYIDGGDLRQQLKHGPLEVRAAVRWAIQFCAGADYAYRKVGLIHRDIKPENLLLTRAGLLKITDFGLSRVEGKILAQSGIMGTPPYMPPEQWIQPEGANRQSDIYSFGVVLYEMLSGKNPFKAATPEEMRQAHEGLIPPDLRSLRPEVPEELAAVAARCIEKNPFRRFFDYDSLQEHLQQVHQIIAGERYTLPQDTEGERWSASQAELLNSGDALRTIGRYREALTYYDRLLDLQPQASLFWQRKGDILARLGKRPEALLYFGKALELEPSNLEAVKGKVRCLLAAGQAREALACCSPVLAMNPNDQELLEVKRQLIGEAGLADVRVAASGTQRPTQMYRPVGATDGPTGSPSDAQPTGEEVSSEFELKLDDGDSGEVGLQPHPLAEVDRMDSDFDIQLGSEPD